MSKLSYPDFCKETIALKKNIERSFLMLGARLFKIYSEQMWEGLYSSYLDFLTMGMEMSAGQASKLINIYQRYIVECGLTEKQLLDSGVPWSSLYASLPLVKDKETALGVLEEMKYHPRKQVEEIVRERTKAPNCVHSDTYKIEVCRDCGTKIQSHDTD